jgi:hypothetical protein
VGKLVIKKYLYFRKHIHPSSIGNTNTDEGKGFVYGGKKI